MLRLAITICLLALPSMACVAFAGTSEPAAQVPNTLKQRIAACTSCHGEHGEGGSDGFNPRLAGKPALYLYHQMLNFRDGRRDYPLMSYMLKPLSNDYLREIATYFAHIKAEYPDRHPPHLPASLMARGHTLVRQGDAGRHIPACQDCHGVHLTGVQPAIPGLLGLPYGYVSAQLGAWRTGTRHTRAPDCMNTIANRLTNADVRAVAAWLAAQPVVGSGAPADSLPHPMPLKCGSVEDAR